jgi:hypothetical protein
MNEENVKTVISRLGREFDSHKFIEVFYTMYEKEYVELLYSYIDSTNGIFRAAHAKIGKYLATNSASLKIQKVNRDDSENIKKYDSENQYWRKLL